MIEEAKDGTWKNPEKKSMKNIEIDSMIVMEIGFIRGFDRMTFWVFFGFLSPPKYVREEKREKVYSFCIVEL